MLVIKAGGSGPIDFSNIARDVARLHSDGRRMILAHGGSDAADALGADLATPPRFLESASGVRSRYTDPATLDILTMALAGSAKPKLVIRLQGLRVPAIGLTGLDGGLVEARRKPPFKARLEGRWRVVRDDLTGTVTRVNVALLTALLDAGYLPVVSPPALDPDCGGVNVDADRLASAVAAATDARDLVILSNVPGLMRDPEKRDSLVTSMPDESFDRHMAFATGRMKLKMIAAREALSKGVERVVLADGTGAEPVTTALAGRGTAITQAALPKVEAQSR